MKSGPVPLTEDSEPSGKVSDGGDGRRRKAKRTQEAAPAAALAPSCEGMPSAASRTTLVPLVLPAPAGMLVIAGRTGREDAARSRTAACRRGSIPPVSEGTILRVGDGELDIGRTGADSVGLTFGGDELDTIAVESARHAGLGGIRRPWAPGEVVGLASAAVGVGGEAWSGAVLILWTADRSRSEENVEGGAPTSAATVAGAQGAETRPTVAPET